MNFSGKVIVVTGAGSGLGRSLALQIGAQGATIACIDYNPTTNQETAALLKAQATPHSVHYADVSDPQEVERVVHEIDSQWNGFDALINNAGIMQSFTTISNLEIEEIHRITQVNYWGTVLFVKACLPILEARSRGLIVNISSLSALLPFPGQTAYSASKAALRIFTEGLQSELRGSGVDVALVMPGTMRTGLAMNSPFHSDEAKEKLQGISEGVGFGLSADQAAAKILAAIRKRRHRITLGIDAWLLDKLYRIAPITTNRLLNWAMRHNPVTKAS